MSEPLYIDEVALAMLPTIYKASTEAVFDPASSFDPAYPGHYHESIAREAFNIAEAFIAERERRVGKPKIGEMGPIHPLCSWKQQRNGSWRTGCGVKVVQIPNDSPPIGEHDKCPHCGETAIALPYFPDDDTDRP